MNETSQHAVTPNLSGRFLRVKAVQELTGLSRSSIYALTASGDFPQPIALGPRSRAWIEAEVRSWMQKRIAESRKA